MSTHVVTHEVIARAIVDKLRTAVGAAARAPTIGDHAVHGVPAAALIDATSADQVAAVLALCSAEGWSVEPVGAGTWTGWGQAPRNPHVVISTRLIDVIDDYQPEDLTVTAGAGVGLTAMQEQLGRHRQWLPLDPPSLPGSTLGACVATASAGPLRARYGTPRDHVLGLDLVTGDGRLLHFGGRVVKNVAGYDIVRPVVGSFGSLGIITRVSMRLRPLPETEQTLALAVPRSAAPHIAAAITDAWPVASIEILSPWLATAVLGATAAHPDWTMLLRIDGHKAEVADGTARIRAIAAAHNAAVSTPGGGVWTHLGRNEAQAAIYVRLAARTAALEHTLKIANSLSDHIMAGPSRLAIHAADGIVRIWGTPAAEDPAGPLQEAVAAMLTIDGTVTSRVAPGIGSRPAGRRLAIEMEILKLFDPAEILTGYRM